MGNKQAKNAREFSNNLPSFCYYINLMSHEPKPTFEQKIEAFKTTKSADAGIKEIFFRRNFGICNSIYSEKIKKLIPSDDLKFLFVLKYFYYIDMYSINDNNIIYTLAEEGEIKDMILISEKSSIIYVTGKGLRSWIYKENVVEDIFSYNLISVKTMAASPNVVYIAVGNNNGQVYLFNCGKHKSCTVLESHKSPINSIIFTQDCEYFLSAGGDMDKNFDCSIRVWSTSKKSLIAILAGHPLEVYTLKLHENNKFLLSLSRDCTIRIWDLEKIISNPQKFKCFTKVISPGRIRFEIPSEIHMKIMEIKKSYRHFDSSYANLKEESFKNYVKDVLESCKEDAEIKRLIMNSDPFYNDFYIPVDAFFIGNYLVAMTSLDKTLSFFNIKSMKKMKTLTFTQVPNSNISLVEGNLVFCDKNTNVHILNSMTGNKNTVIFPGAHYKLADYKLKHSRFLISIYCDIETNAYMLTIWDIKEPKFIGQFFIRKKRLNSVNISEKGDILLTSTFKGSIKVIHIRTRAVLHKTSLKNIPVDYFGLSDDYKYMAAYNFSNGISSIDIWNIKTHKLELNYSHYQNIKKTVFKVNYDTYYIGNTSKPLKIVKTENFNQKYKKLWCASKNFGVLTKEKCYCVYYLRGDNLLIVLE